MATKAQLQEMADKVLVGEVDRSAAAVVGQLLNIKLRAIEIERRLSEAELEGRLDALETRLSELAESSAGARWRA